MGSLTADRQSPSPPRTLSERVVALALSVGFDLAGIAEARPTPESRFLRDWLARGFAGEMHYIGRRVEERVDPRLVLEGAQSAIAVGFVYDPGKRLPYPSGSAGIARYAGGDDYHDVLVDRLRAVEAGLEALAGFPVKTRGYVDTGPVQERVLAAYAGLGWIGKNTCLIHPELGSYFFLGVILTDLELEPGIRQADHCGSCSACIDACPTGALEAEYVLNATRCISYTTIESRGSIAPELRDAHGDNVFGCDICQEVCPWNTRGLREIPPDPLGLRARISPRPEWIRPTLEWILALTEEAWRRETRGTALKRTKYRGLLRNALIASGNSGHTDLLPLLEHHAASGDPILAEHARWAIGRLRGGTGGR